MFAEPDIRDIEGVKVEVTSEEEYQRYLQLYKDVTFNTPEELKTGTVYSSSNGVSVIDVPNEKYSYICPAPLEVGKEVDVAVTNFDKTHFYVSRDAAKAYKQDKMFDNAIESKEIFSVFVEELIQNAGYICTFNGIKLFLPGKESHLNVRKDFDELLNTYINVHIVNYSEKNNTYICSYKSYLKQLREDEVKTMRLGWRYTGTITNIKPFGVFINFNEIFDGLLHKSELKTQYWKLFSNGDLHVGDEIPVWIKEIQNENRIVLTQRKNKKRHENTK